MKICRIYIKGYQQFKDTLLDFTKPDGEPVDKICFIGRNGTGKSTILSLLTKILSDNFPGSNHPEIEYIELELKLSFGRYYWISLPGAAGFFLDKGIVASEPVKTLFENFKKSVISDDIAKKNELIEFYNNLSTYIIKPYDKAYMELINETRFHVNNSDLIIFSPPESVTNQLLNVSNVPTTSLNNALSLFKNFPFYHEVSNEVIEQFWTMLIFLMKRREDEKNKFENLPENLNKTKKQLIEEFDKINPRILDKIALLWNKILEGAKLEFDVEYANNIVQLNDNLLAYIIHKRTRQRIAYNQLSTGIRNFIFRLGHIRSLYFNREIKKGFVFVDEPENSLFPDFLYDLIEVYQGVMVDKNGENNTQFFVSTHSPIIAAQFEPYERVILEWDDEGYVKAFKGNAPVGDDPNDLLKKDFSISNPMGKKGQEVWEEYLRLRRKLRETTDKDEKEKLVSIITKIGSDYNFAE